jgi:tetratricopeptide (TPR) repeat protein
MNDRAAANAHLDRWLSSLIGLVLVVGTLVCWQRQFFPSASERAVREILEGIERRRPEALTLALDCLDRYGSTPFRIALIAKAASACSEHDIAIQHYRKLPADGGQWEFLRNLGLAQRFEILGKLDDEERCLQRALELNPLDLEANERLGHLLQATGRTWESAPYFYMQILRGKCRGDELLGMAVTERFFRSDERLEQAAFAHTPPAAAAQLTVARRMLIDNRQADAEALLRAALQTNPDLGEAQGRLGRIIYDRGDPLEFLQWRGTLLEKSRNHPEVWYVQGLQARRQGQVEGATRCFLEALHRSPNHLAANIQIASCLKQLGRNELATEFTRRGENLEHLESTLNLLRSDVDAAHFQKTVAALIELGRYWEAAGWTYVMTNLNPPPPGLQPELRRLVKLALRENQPNSSEFLPGLKLQRTEFSEPRWQVPASERNSPTLIADSIHWEFEDHARQLGIDFEYYEGTTEETRLQHIFNVVGGGFAAFDYDLDGWCDIHIAQANNWRNPAPQPDYHDRLYRNRNGERFEEVSGLAGVKELGFSHGVTAGDFDQDGFPDLYIGNLGANRLYRNNGDGTFSDMTESAGVAGQEWTTSSTFADFNGDGLPDLYVANYSVIEETAKKECKKQSGELMACTPDVLTAEYHRFYVNRGDGTFRDVTVEAGMRQTNGRGLGLVAWDFTGDGRLGLFVANDTSPNFFYVNSGTSPEGIPLFTEEAVVRGVAFDVDGNAQACMGVAAGDINRDSRMDLFITNFFGESDTLYSQRADGFFDDLTRTAGLRDPGFWMLGFGCQFADFDGDGWDDLVVTNGHVDRESRRGDPDRTRPQLFRNIHAGKFREILPEQLGSFFQSGYLGRGLATLDWNRDGKVDFGVSQLHGRFALVTNVTENENRPLVIRLAGRSGARDPIGALARIQIEGSEVYQMLSAGNGYLVTNETCLRFSIPNDLDSVEVEIRWPGGKTERWSGIVPGQEILLKEGSEKPITLRRLLGSDRNMGQGEDAMKSPPNNP